MLEAVLKVVVPLSVPLLLLVLIFNWRRRWLYYYSAKIPGPFALPLAGSVHLIAEGPHSMHKFLKKLFNDYPSVVKVWLGPELYVSTTEPNYLKILLTKFLDKGNFYHLMSEYFQRALAAAPVDLWKKNRKNVNPTFNVSLIATFVDSFAKHANRLVEDFEDKCGKETEDIFPRIWKSTIDAGCETLADVDPDLIRTEDYLPGVFRIEEILLQRFFHPLLHFDIFWKLSPLKKELINLWKQNCSCVQRLIDSMKMNKMSDKTSEEDFPKKKFLNQLINLHHTNEISHDYLLEEGQIMLFVGTETSAVALSSTLLVLGMYPDVQEKIFEELYSVFDNSSRDPTLEDVNQMDYLERVIRETMRLLPPIPFVMRTVDEHIKLGPYTFPAGARVIIPIAMVHRRPEFWPEPTKFDPDRFLPEEVERRPPCAYIPFSYGVRNCVGYKYGMLSMKVILSTFLRNYKVTSSNYKSTEDVDLLINVVAKPKNGYRIVLEKRKQNDGIYS